VLLFVAAGAAFAAAAAGAAFAPAAAGVAFAAAEAALSGDHHIPVAVSAVVAAVAVHTGSAWEVFAEVLPVPA